MAFYNNLPWLWFPGSRFARPGMTESVMAVNR